MNQLFIYKPITVKFKPKYSYNAEYLTGLGMSKPVKTNRLS